MTPTIQISIKELEQILEIAKTNSNKSEFGSSLIFQQTKECDTHNGSDQITVLQISAYVDCFSREIYNNWDK